MARASDGTLNFRQGLYYRFEKVRPQHLRFSFASSSVELEDTNIRLKNSETDKTAVSFRCGYAGFVRVNDNQMVAFYNSSLSNDSMIIWTQVCNSPTATLG